MRIFLLIIFISLIQNPFDVKGQQNVADSLINLLKNTLEDTNKVLLFDQIGKTLMYSKPFIALEYVKKGMSLAEKIDYQKGIGRGLNRTGSILRLTSNYGKALEMHLASLKVCESNNDLDGLARTNNNIGILYSEQKDSKKAISYFLKSKEIAEKIKNKSLISIVLGNLGADYAILNQLDSARFYTQQAYEMAIKNNGDDLNILLNNLGNIHSRMKTVSLALEYYRLSIPFSLKIDDKSTLTETYGEMSKAYSPTRVDSSKYYNNIYTNVDSSIYYSKKSLALAEDLGNYKDMAKASKTLYEIYEPIDKEIALFYFKKSIAATDSIFNQEKTKQIENLSFNEQLRQLEIAETIKKNESNRIHNLRLYGTGIFIIIFFLFVVLISKRKTNAKVVEFLGLISLLLFFEFINLAIHPFLERISNHNPIIILAFLAVIAAILAPIHHQLTKWLKIKIAHTHMDENIPLLKTKKLKNNSN